MRCEYMFCTCVYTIPVVVHCVKTYCTCVALAGYINVYGAKLSLRSELWYLFLYPKYPTSCFNIYDTTICIYYVRYLRVYNHMLIYLYIITGCIIGHCCRDAALCSSWKPIMLSYHSTYDIMLLDYIRPGYNLIVQGAVSDLSNTGCRRYSQRGISLTSLAANSKKSINNNKGKLS